MKRRPTVWLWVVAVAVLAVSGLAGLRAVLADAHDRQTEGSMSYQDLGLAPRPAEYRHVPLPAGPPPKGAYIASVSYADPASDGEALLFQYPTFTLSVCSVSLKTGRRDACCPQQGKRVIRKEKDAKRYTVFSMSTKHPGALRGSDALEVERFFADAPLRVRPDWVKPYVQTQIDETLGDG